MIKRICIDSLRLLSAAGIIFIVILSAYSCEVYEGTIKANQPPDVWLTSGPPEGSVSSYIVQFFWYGWDKDGDVRYYEYAITDNEKGIFVRADTSGPDKWHRTYSYDSTFSFSADEPADSTDPGIIAEFTRSHTFFIRAVDDKGLASPNPAYRSFTARTLSPTVDITFPEYLGYNPARLPLITTFHWTATDYIDDMTTKQEPDSIRWILVSTVPFNGDFNATLDYIRLNPQAPEWSEWHNYKAPMDQGKSWTTPPLNPGTYIFAAQAKDEAGAVTPVFDERRNARRVLISSEPMAPGIKLCNDYLPCRKSYSINTPLTITDWPAGLSFSFTLELLSTFTKSEYRYGWDVFDFNDETQWDIGWTPYTGASVTIDCHHNFDSGFHTFWVEAINNNGGKSRLGILFNMVPLTMERDLLVVDDYYENPLYCGFINTLGELPCDDEHDAFWLNMLQNIEGFVPAVDFVDVSQDHSLPIVKLAMYKAIIWDTFGGFIQQSNLPYLYDIIKFIPKEPDHHIPDYPFTGRIQPNFLAMYMAMGGHVLICGEQPMTLVINRQLTPTVKLPIIFKYELEGDQDGYYDEQIDYSVGDHSFGFREMCIDVLDIAYPKFSLRNPVDNRCGVIHIRDPRAKEDGLREGLPIDPYFPLITLRPEVAGPGRIYAPESKGLNNELYNPPYFTCRPLDIGPRECFEPIYGHGCLDTGSPLYGAPVAAWTTMFADVVPEVAGGVAARSAVWGFEPVFFDTTAVRQALEIILFDEWQLSRK